MPDRAPGADGDRTTPSDSPSLRSVARSTLDGLRQRDLYRSRRTVEHWTGAFAAGTTSADGFVEPVAIVDGQLKLVFCSNDYLGLSRDPRVIAAFQAASSLHGVGSGASHLVTGHNREHQALEEELAAFVGRERALLFSTGYHANLGVVAALLGRGDTIVEDRLNHASLVDAALLSRARLARYAHADASAAATALQRAEHSGPDATHEGALDDSERKGDGARRLLVTDGVFSMDGDVAPLKELAAACRGNDAWLMVDDAHGLGAMGPGGRGTTASLDVDDVPLLMGTLGKAFGTFGAFVAADDDVIELLIQKARTYIYTTALPPAVAAATRIALRIVAIEEERRARLRNNISHFRSGAAQRQLKVLPSETAIQPLVAGDSGSALAMSESLWQRGLWVSAIRPPTVPENTARLRITLSAAHSRAHIEMLLDALAAAASERTPAATGEVGSP